jgi:hypothetical protein
MLDVAPVEDHADLLRELGAGVEAGDEQGEESDEESVDSPLMEGEDFVLSAEQSSSASESRWWPGILAKNYAAWRRIGTPWVILSWIVFGFCLPFSGERPPEYYHANHPGAFEYAPHVTAAVLSMMAAGVCALVDSRPWICSPLNMIPKTTPGKFRLLLDLRFLNTFLRKLKFKYESVRDAAFAFKENDYMFNIDMESGYWHLGMNQGDWKYLGFEWGGKYYVFKVLPFGLSVACWAFTKLTRVAVKALRAEGIRLIHLLDDMGFAAQGFEAATALVVRVVDFLQNLGFVINFGKSMMTPAQLMRFLGFLIDSVKGLFLVPEDKKEKLMSNLKNLVESAHTRARVLFSVGGQLLSMQLALGQAAILYSRAFYRVVVGRDLWDWEVPVSAELREAAKYWLRFFDKWNGAKIWQYKPIKIVHAWVDASEFAWGGWTTDFGAADATGVLPRDMLGTSSNLRELYGFWMLLQSLIMVVRGCIVRLRTDNQAAYYITRKGGHMDPEFNDLLSLIFEWCLVNDVRLWVEWIRRDRNVLADGLSKVRDSADWKLLPHWFAQLSARWGPFDVDRMASHMNAQLPRFNSRFLCPGTEAVNCFSQDWRGCNNWVNPPFHLISRVAMHMRFCRAKGCVLVPYWPGAPWWHLLFPDGKNKGPGVKAVWHFPKKQALFAEAYGGSHTSRPPICHLMAVFIDFS